MGCGRPDPSFLQLFFVEQLDCTTVVEPGNRAAIDCHRQPERRDLKHASDLGHRSPDRSDRCCRAGFRQGTGVIVRRITELVAG